MSKTVGNYLRLPRGQPQFWQCQDFGRCEWLIHLWKISFIKVWVAPQRGLKTVLHQEEVIWRFESESGAGLVQVSGQEPRVAHGKCWSPSGPGNYFHILTKCCSKHFWTDSHKEVSSYSSFKALPLNCPAEDHLRLVGKRYNMHESSSSV